MRLEHVKCNLCAADDARRLFEQRDSFSVDPASFSVVECGNCGLIYVNPRPGPADIHRFYTSDYIAYQFELAESPAASLRERLVEFVTRSSARSKARFVADLVQLQPQLRVLDVGCGKAAFLHELHARYGCEVTGLDFDESAVEYSRSRLGVSILNGSTDALAGLGAIFDVVTMWHFLEHDFDPLATLGRINATLRDGGLLVLEIPNAESLENRVFGRHSFLYDAPRHLYDFSPRTITALLARAGFRVERIVFPWMSGGWIGSIQNVVWQGRMYRALRRHIYAFVAVSVLAFPLESMLSMTRAGSIMRVVARKGG